MHKHAMMPLSLSRYVFLSFIALTALWVISHAVMAEGTGQLRYVNAQQAQDMLGSNPDIIVLDVRTSAEHRRGHIEGAVQLNYFSLNFRKKLRALERNAPYLIHCKSGHRSARTIKLMQDEGFTDIIHLNGGYDAYKALAATPSGS